MDRQIFFRIDGGWLDVLSTLIPSIVYG